MITTLGKTFPRKINKNVVEIGETRLDELLNNNTNNRELRKSQSMKGKLYKGATSNAYNREGLGSIPQRNEIILIKSISPPKGFSSNSERFPNQSTDKISIPGPGTYNTRESTNEMATPSISSKGYGVGFVSKKDRFDDLQEYYAQYLPGPGEHPIKNNITEDANRNMLYKGLFLEKKGERLIPKKENPGPGTYDYDYSWIKDKAEANFFFKDKVKKKKMISIKGKDFPGPADYFKTYKDLFIKDGEKENFFFKRPIEKKEDIIEKYLEVKKKDKGLGPGSYIFDNQIKKDEPIDTLEMNSILEREEKNNRAKKRRFLSVEIAKSIVGTTDFYEKPSQFDAISKDNNPNAIFVSESQRLNIKSKFPVPGPTYYKPAVIPNNINFNCNEEVWK